MKNIASLRDHALNLRRALWKSMICFRVVDHDVEQNHRKILSMVFDFLLFAARRVHRSGQMTGYEICPPPGSGPPLIHYTTFVVPKMYSDAPAMVIGFSFDACVGTDRYGALPMAQFHL